MATKDLVNDTYLKVAKSPITNIYMFAFQMREAVIVFATENKYGAQVDQIREGDNNKKGPFSSCLL